jgi:predicted amidohydrolase
MIQGVIDRLSEGIPSSRTIRKGLSIFVSLMLFLLPVSSQEKDDASEGGFTLASCQFPVSDNIRENFSWIREQLIEARLKKAEIVHFPECALSGYPGVDFTSMESYNWDLLAEKTDSVLKLARRLELWVLLGSIHPLEEGKNPTNCLYLINPMGKIVDRYDKRFCTEGDLKFFTPGNRMVNFDLNGINCGLLICYDVRFPELYREYKRLGTEMIFQSFYNARQGPGSIHPVIMPITSQARAATNHFFMSITNSSAPESWPCHFITPDGLIQNKSPLNEAAVLISVVDPTVKYYDASRHHRERALNGILNSADMQD